MTPNEINRAIAESVGWSARPENPPHWGFRWKDPTGEVWCFLPNYYGDLNAIHEAARIGLKTREDKMECGMILLDVCAPSEAMTLVYALAVIADATAPQRCEAYLRTIGKWRGQ